MPGARLVLTVDVEEWFHVCGHPTYDVPERWESFPSRVVPSTERILELLDRTSSHATFFVLGWVARRHPGLVRRIAEAGHEIGCHGDLHRRVEHHDGAGVPRRPPGRPGLARGGLRSTGHGLSRPGVVAPVDLEPPPADPRRGGVPGRFLPPRGPADRGSRQSPPAHRPLDPGRRPPRGAAPRGDLLRPSRDARRRLDLPLLARGPRRGRRRGGPRARREPRPLPPPVGGRRGAPPDGALAHRPARPLRRARPRRPAPHAPPLAAPCDARSPRPSRPAPSGGRWRREVRGALPGTALGEGGNGRGARRAPSRTSPPGSARSPSGPGSTSRPSSSATGDPDLHDDLPAQVGVFAVSVAVLDVLAKEHGLAPAACAGYSLGTYAAFVGAGVLDRRTALDVLLEAERLLRERAPAGAMGFVIGVPEVEVAAELARLTRDPHEVAIGNVNAAQQVVLTGRREPVLRALDHLAPRALRAEVLPLGWPMHSPALEPVTDGLSDFVARHVRMSWPGRAALYAPMLGRRGEERGRGPAGPRDADLPPLPLVRRPHGDGGGGGEPFRRDRSGRRPLEDAPLDPAALESGRPRGAGRNRPLRIRPRGAVGTKRAEAAAREETT